MTRNVVSNWIGLLVTGALSLVLTPILISELGPFAYGMWVMVGALVDYCGLLDLGVRATFQRFVARWQGTDARQALDETFMTGVALAAGVGVLTCLLSVFFAPSIAVFFAVPDHVRPTFIWTARLLGLSLGIAFPSRLIAAYLLGLQRFDVYNGALIVMALVRGAGIIAVLRAGGGVLGVAIVSLATSVVSLCAHWWLVRRVDPDVRLDPRAVRWSRGCQMIRFSAYVFMGMVGDQLRFYTSSLVIGRLLGIAAITPFSVASLFMEYFRTAVFAIIGPLLPAMSALDGHGREKELRDLFLSATRVTAFVSLFLAGMLLLNSRALVTAWLGEHLAMSSTLILILAAAYVTALSQSPMVVFLQARGRHQVMGWWTLAEGLSNLFLSIYLGTRFGLIGVALGAALPMLFIKLTLQPWYTLRILKITPAQYARTSLLDPVRVTAAFLLIAGPATYRIDPGRPLTLVLLMSVEVTLFVALAWAGGLSRDEKHTLSHQLKRVLPRAWSGQKEFA